MVILLTFIAALSKSIIDILDHHYNDSLFSLFNPFTFGWEWFAPSKDSSKNKYKDVNTLEPKFFGSTTFFVWVTDAFHFFNMTYRLAFLGLIWYYAENGFTYFWWTDLPFILCLHAVLFHLLYHHLLTKKFWRL